MYDIYVRWKSRPDPLNLYFPGDTININYYVSGKNYTIYYTGGEITQRDKIDRTYKPNVDKIDVKLTNEFKSKFDRYEIPTENFNAYGVYEVYEESELLTRFVIITKKETETDTGAGYYDINGDRIGTITGDTLSHEDSFDGDKTKDDVAWVIVPDTVTEFNLVKVGNKYYGAFQEFPKLIACYFIEHKVRDITINGNFENNIFSDDSNLVAVNYNDLISYLEDSNGLNLIGMFIGCNGITNVSFSKGTFSGLTVNGTLTMLEMFADCIGITNVSFNEGAFSGLTVNGTLYMFGVFSSCIGITSVNFNEGAFSGLTVNDTLDMTGMFADCIGIANVSFNEGAFSGLSVDILDMDNMFYGCDGITSVSFKKGAFSGLSVDTLDMRAMFACDDRSSITNIELNDVFSLTPNLYIDLFGGTTTNINTIIIRENDIQKVKLSSSSGDTHGYNLFNFTSIDKETNENNEITLIATDAVVKMLVDLNTEDDRQISLTYTANTELTNDNKIHYAFTLTYTTGNVWNIDTHPSARYTI